MKGDDYRQQERDALAQVAREVETFVRLFYESQVNQQGFMQEAYRLLQAQSREVEDIREQALVGEDLVRKLDEVMERLNLLPNLLPHLIPGLQSSTTGGQTGGMTPGTTGGAGQTTMPQTGAGGTVQTQPPMQPSGGYTGPGPAKMGQPGAGGFSGGYQPQTGGLPEEIGGMSGSVPGAGIPGGLGGMSGSMPGAGGVGQTQPPMQPIGGYTGPGPAKMGQPGAGGFSGGYHPQMGGQPEGLGGISGSVPGGLGGMSGSMPGTGMPSGSLTGTPQKFPGHIISGTSPTLPGTSHTLPGQESVPIPLADQGPEAVPVLKPIAERQAEVRFLHASPDAPAVDIYVDHRKVESYVPYQSLSHYMPIEPGRHRVQVFPAGVSVGALVDTTVDFKPDRSYTITAGGVLKEIRSIVVEDDRTAPKPGFARLKIVHLAPNAPAVDVTLPSGKVLLSHLTFKEKSPAIQVAPGTRELDVRLAGKPDVVLKVPKIKFEPNTAYTLYITGLVGREPGLSPLVVREQ